MIPSVVNNTWAGEKAAASLANFLQDLDSFGNRLLTSAPSGRSSQLLCWRLHTLLYISIHVNTRWVFLQSFACLRIRGRLSELVFSFSPTKHFTSVLADCSSDQVLKWRLRHFAFIRVRLMINTRNNSEMLTVDWIVYLNGLMYISSLFLHGIFSTLVSVV